MTAPATIRGTLKTMAEHHTPRRHGHPNQQSREYVEGFSKSVVIAITTAFKNFLLNHSENENLVRFFKRQILDYLPENIIEEIHNTTHLEATGAVTSLTVGGSGKYLLANNVVVC
ncbi:hypothetical protein CPB97_010225 [Podila verticillata]|nr:hypothetical protein CPB97_010225 [Podila verticillata]